MNAAARVLAVCCTLSASLVLGQESPPPTAPPQPEPEERSTGLPAGLDWTFNLDASWGSFGFANSLYADAKPEQPAGDLGDNWFEGSAKPGITGIYTNARSWQVYGQLSVVGERTYGAAPSPVGEDASSFKVEDAHLGWRSGNALGSSENLLELTVGRARYELGRGLLLWDGSSEGGTRGGYWTNARKAFAFAAIGRLRPGRHTLEAFYLDKDDLPEADSGTRLWGANYELALGEDTTLGATYMRWSARPEEQPQRDGLNVYNVRAFSAPFAGRLRALFIEAEYAREENGDALDSNAWTALVAWQFGGRWKPKLSYRYALFEGDDPATTANEAFDPLLPGFHDWGSWWQGEIAGEYFVSNSNLISHQVRLGLEPSDAIGTGLIVYDLQADEPASLGPEVTERDVAVELDWYLDWKVNENFSVSVVAAYANPGALVQQLYERTKDFVYGMIYIGYSY